jgi:acyl phosphate:glycerol-3-phosphate acyltransferase
VIFGWSWMLGLVFSAIWLLVFFAIRISSASALAAMAVTALAAFAVMTPVVGWWPLLLLAAAVWAMHRANIARLLKGVEPKTSFSKTA